MRYLANFLFLQFLLPCGSDQGSIDRPGYGVSPNALGNFDWNIEFNYIFDIIINERPVLEEEADRTVQPSPLTLYSKHGQKHLCTLPSLSAEEDDNTLKQPVQNVKDLLEPLKKSCFRKTVDWWTYEYCHGRHIQQYHLQGGQVMGQVIDIGFYKNESDWSDVDMENVKKHEGMAHEVNYVEGSKCDLTNKPRRATAKISCSFSGDGLERIAEPEPCVYVVTVKSSQLCMHPLFTGYRKHQRARITCSPVLTEDEYQQYKEMEGERGQSMDRNEETESEDVVDNYDSQLSVDGYTNKDLMQTVGSFIGKLAGALGEAAEEALETRTARDDTWIGSDSEDVADDDQSKEKFKHAIEKLKNKLQDNFLEDVDEDFSEELDEDTEVADHSPGEPTESPVLTPVQVDPDDVGYDNDVGVSEEVDTFEDGDDAQHFDVGGWKVRVSSADKSVTSEDEEDESLKELQEQVSKELQEKLEEMGVKASGKVKVRFVTNQDFDGENEEDVNKLMRSLPEDTNKMVSNYIKDVFSGGKLSQREKEKHSQLEDNYNKIWTSEDSEKGSDETSKSEER